MRSSRKEALTLALAVFLAGCGPRLLLLHPGDPAEYARISGAGTGRIQGQAFLNTAGGETRRAAGMTVYLDPATSLVREWADSTFIPVDQMRRPLPDGVSPTDATFLSARRQTKGDADGNFTFDRLKPGRYLITTTIQWDVGSSWIGKQGGRLWELVTVPDTGTVRVIMNRMDNPYRR